MRLRDAGVAVGDSCCGPAFGHYHAISGRDTVPCGIPGLDSS
jgi:hypothetical protein